ncbi:MAG: terminase large subunit [Bacteroidales bacterium]|nr:terminase large subunit [Bacteroidales bacterium]
MKKMTNIERVQEWCRRSLAGEIPCCLMVRKAIERWQADLERPDLTFDEKAFNRFVRFAREFKHYKGPMAGQRFQPEPWQLFVMANVIGLKRVDTGLRKYTYADIYVPRKNGKTFLAAIFAGFFLLKDGEAGPEVYTAAVDQAQARLCYDASAELIRTSIFADDTKPYQWGMKSLKNAGVFKPLSKDTKNKDGLNISAAICDERHAWPNTEIYDVIKTGMGARSQPVLLSISTAGTDTSNPYFADIEAYKDILLGLKQKDNHFLLLFCPDEGDAWDDPATWAKVNPNLGVSLSLDYMRAECEEAKLRGGTYQVAFQTKNLNMWVNAPDVWISDEDVQANNAAFDLEQLKGAECYVGLDLASKGDISAVCLFFPAFRVARWLFVVPEAKVEEMKDRVDYRLWKDEGWLTVTPGKVLDEDWFVDYLINELEPYDVRCLAYDPWAMWNLVPKLRKYEDKLVAYQQSIRYMSVPSKWIQTEVLQHRLNFLGNPVIRWMFRNVVIYTDPNANIKLDKARSRNKIDGVVALADAVGGWLNITGGETKEIYKEHTLRVISMND